MENTLVVANGEGVLGRGKRSEGKWEVQAAS